MKTDKLKKKIEKHLGFELKRKANNSCSEKDDYILDKLGHSDLNKEQLRDTAKKILKFLKESPESELMWASLGYIYYHLGEFKKSVTCAQKTININPKNTDNWIDLGFAYRANREIKKSNKIFLKKIKKR